MWLKRMAAVIAAGMFAIGCSPSRAAPAEPAVGQRIDIPAVTLLDGRTLPAGYFKGKPVVVEYWASWCPFCARQNPYVQKLTEKAKNTGLEILTVSIDRVDGDARSYVRKHRYTFPVAMETPELRKVFGKRRVIPQIFVVDASGRLVEAIPGEMFEEDVLELIKYAPAGSPATPSSGESASAVEPAE